MNTTKESLEAAARDVARAIATHDSDPQFALGCVGDARLALAAATIELRTANVNQMRAARRSVAQPIALVGGAR